MCSEFRGADENGKICSKVMKNVLRLVFFAVIITECSKCNVTSLLNETPRHEDAWGNEDIAASILSLSNTWI
jgi:hypothetical protein